MVESLHVLYAIQGCGLQALSRFHKGSAVSQAITKRDLEYTLKSATPSLIYGLLIIATIGSNLQKDYFNNYLPYIQCF